MTIDPRGLTAYQWSDAMQPRLMQFGIAPIMLSDADWKGWARLVIQMPGISSLRPPVPDDFANWQDWAIRLNEFLDRG